LCPFSFFIPQIFLRPPFPTCPPLGMLFSLIIELLLFLSRNSCPPPNLNDGLPQFLPGIYIFFLVEVALASSFFFSPPDILAGHAFSPRCQDAAARAYQQLARCHPPPLLFFPLYGHFPPLLTRMKVHLFEKDFWPLQTLPVMGKQYFSFVGQGSHRFSFSFRTGEPRSSWVLQVQ